MGRAATVPSGVTWITLSFIIFFHAGALASFFFFSWSRLALMVILYVLAINVGIGMCYHRLLTHRGYQTPKWIEYLMTICATLSLEGGPIFWVSTHRVHHQLSDHEGDPHTPREGGWWAHAGWILFGKALHAQTQALKRYSPDLRGQVPRLDEQVPLGALNGQRGASAGGWLDLGRICEWGCHGLVGCTVCA